MCRHLTRCSSEHATHCECNSIPPLLDTDMLLRQSTAHRSGVTVATGALLRKGNAFGDESPFIAGLSTTFRTGAAHALQRGAIVQNVAALHVALGRPHPVNGITGQVGASVSGHIATLRRLLFGFEPKETETGRWFKQAVEGGNSIASPEVISLTSLVLRDTVGGRSFQC